MKEVTLQDYLMLAHPDWRDIDGDASCPDCGAPIVRNDYGRPIYDCTCRIERWLEAE